MHMQPGLKQSHMSNIQQQIMGQSTSTCMIPSQSKECDYTKTLKLTIKLVSQQKTIDSLV